MTAAPIATEAEYDAALARLLLLMDAALVPGSPEDAEFDALADAIQAYERRVYPAVSK